MTVRSEALQGFIRQFLENILFEHLSETLINELKTALHLTFSFPVHVTYTIERNITNITFAFEDEGKQKIIHSTVEPSFC